MDVMDVYPERRTLGSVIQAMIENVPQYIYQRGGEVFPDSQWALSGKKPRIRQFVLTSADYCKLYLTVLSLHVRRAASAVPITSSEQDVFVPLSLGLVSRTPYLAFPKVFLSYMHHAVTQGASSDVIFRALAQALHGVPVPIGSSCVSVWSLPRLDAPHQALLFMGGCGLEGAASEEARPLPSSFERGASEVDLSALFDVLSVETILSVLGLLLLEQKILLVSSQYPSSFIAHLCEALRVLMYPFDWQHVFIPLIPAMAKETLTSGKIPQFIDSALTQDHIHPLRFLEAPAPVFGGLRVRGGACNDSLRQIFPDVNIVDLDAGIVVSASHRVDRSSALLPTFPKKLVAIVSSRLPEIVEGRAERLRTNKEKYVQFESVVGLEFFRGPESSESVKRKSSARATGQRRSSIFGSWTKRKSLSDMGTFSVSLQIQAAVLKAFVKMLYPYREFLFIDRMVRQASTLSVGSGGGFVGSDRHFIADQFLKCFERNSHLEAVTFLTAFFRSQSWDLFIRTTALHPIAHVFDTACAYYALLHKVDYLRYKQFVAAVQTDSNPRLAASPPQAVLDETDKLKPTPVGKRSKDHFFDELVAFVTRTRTPDSLMYSAPWGGAGPTKSPEWEDVVAKLSHVMTAQLPAVFPDANVEANKLHALAISESVWTFADVVSLRDAFPSIRAGNMEAHLVQAIVRSFVDPKVAPPSPGEGGDRVRSPVTSYAKITTSSEESRMDDAVSMWSGRARLVKQGTTVDESKLLGGIPRSALSARVPQAALFLIRNWPKGYFRPVFHCSHVARVDFSCASCASSSSLDDVLHRSRWLELDSEEGGSEHVSVTCERCDGVIVPEFFSSETGSNFKILKLANLVKELEFPLTAEAAGNLSILFGLHVELYTSKVSEGVKGWSFRGLVAFKDLVADFLLCSTVSGMDADGDAAESPRALPAVPSPVRSESEESSGSESLPDSPTRRAQVRVRQYRKKLSSGARMLSSPLNPAPPPVLRIHVDAPPNRFEPTTRTARAESPPAPPSERRPADAAPRRARRSGGGMSEADIGSNPPSPLTPQSV